MRSARPSMPYMSCKGPSRVAVRIVPAVLQPVPESRRLFGEADTQQAVHRERGVANPGVAVVPIAHAADRLRQAAGRGCDNRPGRLEREELERQGGALDDFTPAAGVGAVSTASVASSRRCRGTVLPPRRAPGQRLGAGLRIEDGAGQTWPSLLLEGKVGDDAIAIVLQRHGSGQSKA